MRLGNLALPAGVQVLEPYLGSVTRCAWATMPGKRRPSVATACYWPGMSTSNRFQQTSKLTPWAWPTPAKVACLSLAEGQELLSPFRGTGGSAGAEGRQGDAAVPSSAREAAATPPPRKCPANGCARRLAGHFLPADFSRRPRDLGRNSGKQSVNPSC